MDDVAGEVVSRIVRAQLLCVSDDGFEKCFMRNLSCDRSTESHLLRTYLHERRESREKG